MTKAEALHAFWSGFGIKAYDENTVPTGENRPQMPYITYSVQTDSIGGILSLTGSVWYRSTSWLMAEQKVDEIARAVGGTGFYIQQIDGGYLWITKASPFAQRMADPEDDMIRRIYVMLNGEFITAF